MNCSTDEQARNGAVVFSAQVLVGLRKSLVKLALALPSLRNLGLMQRFSNRCIAFAAASQTSASSTEWRADVQCWFGGLSGTGRLSVVVTARK